MSQRLSVNINDECAYAIKNYAKSKDINVTEAIRHAISVLSMIHGATSSGMRIFIQDTATQKKMELKFDEPTIH